MDKEQIYELANQYALEIKETQDYQMLLYYKKMINETLMDKVKNFKAKQEQYNEALKYAKYHPDIKKYQNELSEAKKELYSEEIVIKYFECERRINDSLKVLSNDIASIISNKFNKEMLF